MSTLQTIINISHSFVKILTFNDKYPYFSMRDDSASNCSNSAISAQTKKHCDCEIHSKPQKDYGNFLHPNYVADFKRSNTPCHCSCEKCKGHNKHMLNENKIDTIKKRVAKAVRKIEENESVLSKWNRGASAQSRINGEKGYEQNTMAQINNLAGLKTMIQISGLFQKS